MFTGFPFLCRDELPGEGDRLAGLGGRHALAAWLPLLRVRRLLPVKRGFRSLRFRCPRFEPWRLMPPLYPDALFGPLPAFDVRSTQGVRLGFPLGERASFHWARFPSVVGSPMFYSLCGKILSWSRECEPGNGSVLLRSVRDCRGGRRGAGCRQGVALFAAAFAIGP